MNEKARQAATSLVSRLKKSVEIMEKFREQRIPLVVALLPRVYTNLDEGLLAEGYYFISHLVPNIVRDYLIFKRALVGEELVDSGAMPPTAFVDLAVVRFFCMLLLNLDDYLNGALTSLSPVISYTANTPVDDVLKHIHKIPPLTMEGIDVRKVIAAREVVDGEEKESAAGDSEGDEQPATRRRYRRKGARTSSQDSEPEA